MEKLPLSLRPFFISFLFFSMLTGAFFNIYCNNHHKDIKCVLGVGNVDGVGVGKVEKLLGDFGDMLTPAVDYLVVPLHNAAPDLPALAVDGKAGAKYGKIFVDCAHLPVADIHIKPGKNRYHPLLQRAHMSATCIVNFEAMPPRKLPLHHKYGVAVIVVYVIAVEPGNKPLSE